MHIPHLGCQKPEISAKKGTKISTLKPKKGMLLYKMKKLKHNPLLGYISWKLKS